MVSIMLPELFVTPTIDPKWSVSKNAAVPPLLIRANSSLTWSPHKYRVCIVFVLLRSAHTFQFELPVLPARAGSQPSRAYFVTVVPDDVATDCSIRLSKASYS